MTRRRGEQHPQSKLTEEQVAEIRKSSRGPSELGRQYGVSKATISLIKRGKLWAAPAKSPAPTQGTAPPVQSSIGPEPAAPVPKSLLFPSAEDSIS